MSAEGDAAALGRLEAAIRGGEPDSVLIALWSDSTLHRESSWSTCKNYSDLHRACQWGAPMEVVRAIARRSPLEVGVSVRGAGPQQYRGRKLASNGGRGRPLPRDFAYDDQEALLGLVLADLPFAAGPAGEPVPREHFYTWSWLMDFAEHRTPGFRHADYNLEPEEHKTVTPVAKRVFSLIPHWGRALAYFPDIHGRPAYSTTSNEVRHHLHQFVLFCGRYRLQDGPPLHRSATAAVCLAADCGARPGTWGHQSEVRVALKFMACAQQFEREHSVRSGAGFDEKLVVSVLRTHSASPDSDSSAGGDDADEDIAHHGFAASSVLFNLSAYQYCLVMPAADRSLKAIIDSEHIAGRDWPAVKVIAEQLVRCVGHVHDKGLVHGDIKPLNVMRVGAQIKLIDLDGAASFVSDPPQLAASKSSSAFLPPELMCVDATTGLVGVRRGCVAAHWSQDMWALGCVLYHLFAGEPLFLSNDEDNLTEEADLQRLVNWASQLAHKERRLSRISHTAARYLVSQLLSANPALRPSAQMVLAHSFFTGRQVGRMVGQEASFDVFISYRVDSDAALAAAMYNKLTARGVRVWLDVKCLADGQDWEEGFCNGLVQSRCLLPILSKSGIKARFEQSACDNVYLEHRLATELQARGLVERIFPLFVGDLDAATERYGDYFQQGCQPSPASSSCVAAVEAKLRQHLDSQGLGLPLQAAPSVKDVLGDITINQGGFVKGQGQDLDATLDTLADRVAGVVRDLAGSGRGALCVDDGPVRRELGQERRAKEEGWRRVAALEAVLRAHNLPPPP